MDVLSDVLNLLSARSYVTSGLSATSDWAVHYPGFDGLKFFSIRKGCLWLRMADEPSWHCLCEGDSILLTRGIDFTLATHVDDPVREADDMPFVRRGTIADYGGNDVVALAGKMELDNGAGGLLLSELPPVVIIRGDSREAATLGWLMGQIQLETQTSRPGAAVVTDHLMHLIMIEGIRSCLANAQRRQVGWLSALEDPRMFKVLNALHDEPARAWRLNELAALAGMSRAGFARRFTDIIGSSPLDYLARWRIHLASRALSQTRDSIKHIALSLGYGSESAFSTAFKRVRGYPPSALRRQAMSPVDPNVDRQSPTG